MRQQLKEEKEEEENTTERSEIIELAQNQSLELIEVSLKEFLKDYFKEI